MIDDPDDPKDQHEDESENSSDEAVSDEGRKPPPDDLEKDPAYNPPDEFKGIKGG